MIQVTKKDPRESSESLIRRFTRRVMQSGVVIQVKSKQNFERPISKRDRRSQAIVRRQRKEAKLKNLKLGIK